MRCWERARRIALLCARHELWREITMKDASSDDLPRVLFLHGIDAGPTGTKQRLIQRAVGRSKFFAPDLKTRRLLFLYTVLYGTLLLVLLITTILCWVFTNALVAFAVTMLAIALGVVGYVFGGRGLSALLLKSAVRVATEAFNNFRPQIIVASSFGAVVAFSMDVPKLPLLLFTPAQDTYRRYFRTTEQTSLRQYPYTLIVHGSRDTTVLLEDSIRLVETSELGRCRLEVIDDDHSLRSLTQEEVSGWVDEVFKRGRANVLSLAEEGDKSVDPSLYEPLQSPYLDRGEGPDKEKLVDEAKTSSGSTGSFSPNADPDYASSTSVEDSDFFLP